MTRVRDSRSRSFQALIVLGILLFGFSLRTAVTSLSPILSHVDGELALPAMVVGLIGAAPLVCFGVMGMLTPLLERRVGLEGMVVVATLVVAVGLGLRGVVGDPVGLLLATLLIFAAVGVGNVLLPPLVKKYFPGRIGLMTGIYTTTMAVATFAPALVAVPLAESVGWRMSLASWSLFALVALVPWIRVTVLSRRAGPDEAVERANPDVLRRLWQSPLAWALTAAFVATSAIAYTSFAWLPRILVDTAGVDAATAGALLSLFAAMSLPPSLLVPILVARYGMIRTLFFSALGVGVAGCLGLLLLPGTATWLWVSLLGLTPIMFPLVVVLLSLRTRSHQTTVALSAMVQSVGYGIAALFPLAAGVLHDELGGWSASLGVLAAVLVLAAPAGIVMFRTRSIEDEWERRRGPW